MIDGRGLEDPVGSVVGVGGAGGGVEKVGAVLDVNGLVAADWGRAFEEALEELLGFGWIGFGGRGRWAAAGAEECDEEIVRN